MSQAGLQPQDHHRSSPPGAFTFSSRPTFHSNAHCRTSQRPLALGVVQKSVHKHVNPSSIHPMPGPQTPAPHPGRAPGEAPCRRTLARHAPRARSSIHRTRRRCGRRSHLQPLAACACSNRAGAGAWPVARWEPARGGNSPQNRGRHARPPSTVRKPQNCRERTWCEPHCIACAGRCTCACWLLLHLLVPCNASPGN